MKKLDYLIEYLLQERKEKNNIEDYTEEEKKMLFRSLCNVRKPDNISKDFLKVQDDYLKDELKKKLIVSSIDKYKIDGPIHLWKGDITTLKIEAIVNAANSGGLGCFVPCHKCIDNAIHSASGIQLRLDCLDVMKKIKILKTGEAFVTQAHNLSSKYIIHTVGPIIYDEVTKEKQEELKNCYISSLDIAIEKGIKEIVFPCISTGEFRFSKELACKIAINTVKEYLEKNNNFDKIVFNVFSDEDLKIYERNFKK